MRVVINSLELVRGTDYREVPKDFKIKSKKNIQVSPLLRAKTAKVYDRGNLKTVVTFRVVRTHETQELAQSYALNHVADITHVHGSAVFYMEDATSGAYVLSDATVSSVRSRPEGVLSHHEYELIGTEFKPYKQ